MQRTNMTQKIKIALLTGITLFASLQAEENYLGTLGLTTKTKTLNDKYCHTNKDKSTLCMEYQLQYPENVMGNSKSLDEKIMATIKPYTKSYKKGNAKKYIVSFLKEGDYNTSGTWSDETTISLFSTTDETFCLEVTGGGYMGGAHGNYATSFDNYNIQSAKKFSLKDVLIPNYNKELANIASRYYKIINELKEDGDLRKLDWFNNKFVLAENYAITSKGIYFLYNAYEIQPYSSGQSSFLLPYSTFLKLIKPYSF